jgi:omega-amidase
MRDTVTVSLVQLAPVLLAPEENAKRMAGHVAAEASQHASDLIVFPELASVGPVLARLGEDGVAAAAEPVPGPTTDTLAGAAREHGAHVVAGILERDGDRLYSSAVVIDAAGAVAGVYRRLHLAPDERRVLSAGDSVGVYETGLGNLAVSLSYDVNFPELARVQALEGAEILATLWSTTEPPGRQETDGIVVQCRSRATENFVYVLGCNVAAERTSRSVIVSCNGEVVAEAAGEGEEVVRGSVTERAFRDQRMYLTIFRDRRPELYGPLVETG